MHLFDSSIASDPEFRDRRDAGQKLSNRLLADNTQADIVIGLTGGGVPVAAIVAEVLGLPLDIIVVKKIGAPGSDEFAIGAVCSDGSRVLHEDVIQQLNISSDYVHDKACQKLSEARAAEDRYRGGAAPDLDSMVVLIIDDGIATGSTMEAAVISARNRGAKRVVVAVPVASPESKEMLSQVADEVLGLVHTSAFFSVGQYYTEFDHVGDEEIVRLVKASKNNPIR